MGGARRAPDHSIMAGTDHCEDYTVCTYIYIVQIVNVLDYVSGSLAVI